MIFTLFVARPEEVSGRWYLVYIKEARAYKIWRSLALSGSVLAEIAKRACSWKFGGG